MVPGLLNEGPDVGFWVPICYELPDTLFGSAVKNVAKITNYI